jgi:hypothetical protein
MWHPMIWRYDTFINQWNNTTWNLMKGDTGRFLLETCGNLWKHDSLVLTGQIGYPKFYYLINFSRKVELLSFHSSFISSWSIYHTFQYIHYRFVRSHPCGIKFMKQNRKCLRKSKFDPRAHICPRYLINGGWVTIL